MDHQLDEGGWNEKQHADWLGWCRERMACYPAVTKDEHKFKGRINPYLFIETLFDQLTGDDVVVTGNATACIVSFQVAKLKLGQRLFSNSGAASMGYDLPAAIGAAVARGGKRVICLAGDANRCPLPAPIEDLCAQ
jgi:acetolactate synthase-1/2/3 large subunit